MFTATAHNRIKHGIKLIALTLLVVACDRKCQPPATEPFKTITGIDWRLVETTDPSPQFKKLSNTTFLIFKYNADYTGTINQVVNNTKADNPTLIFIYNIDIDSNRIRAKYTDPNAAPETSPNDPGGGGGPGGGIPSGGAGALPDVSTQTPAADAIDYDYALSRQFELYDTKKGYYYRFVPFKGIIEPDNKCVF